MNWSLSDLVKNFLIDVFSYRTIVNFQVTRSFTRGYNYMFTLLVTNISHQKSLLKMIFLFPRWDMLVPCSVDLLNVFLSSSFVWGE